MILKDDELFFELSDKEGQQTRKLISYGEADGFCLSIDLIAEEDAQELIRCRDDLSEAFDGCGSEEVFRNKTTRQQSLFYDMDLVYQIIRDDEIALFMQKVVNAHYANGLVDALLDWLDEDMDNFKGIQNLCIAFKEAEGRL